jgi:hypothetical protein
VLGGVLLMTAVQLFALGVLADLIASHRVVTQRTLERVRRVELALGVPPSHYERGTDGAVGTPPTGQRPDGLVGVGRDES